MLAWKYPNTYCMSCKGLDKIYHINGLMQERRNSSALAMELRHKPIDIVSLI